jgi:hypothetical protein
MSIPFSGDGPAEEHADDETAAPKYDVYGHGYVICKSCIVQQ